MLLEEQYRGRRVLVTGATGFKGAWLASWLVSLGAEVHGFSLAPTDPRDLYVALGLEGRIRHRTGDLRDQVAVDDVVEKSRPEVIFHLAAQSLVRPSYADPVGTFATNVMGTIHLLDAVRRAGRPVAIVVVTSDKCYENRESDQAYGELDALGGADPYSASKGATEIAVASYRRSFFPPARLAEHGVAVATARAGNVIGPGDHALDRLVPDAIHALIEGRTVPVRNPRSVRPWQHVLEPLAGYLELGASLRGHDASAYCEAWNFGPSPTGTQTVERLIAALIAAWGSGAWSAVPAGEAVHEARLLRLSIDKALARLAWRPVWGFDEVVAHTVAGYRALHRGEADVVRNQIDAYMRAASFPMSAASSR
jgi:CDP-glucose 4,6-dehydratase